jgi:hypothetical protein
LRAAYDAAEQAAQVAYDEYFAAEAKEEKAAKKALLKKSAEKVPRVPAPKKKLDAVAAPAPPVEEASAARKQKKKSKDVLDDICEATGARLTVLTERKDHQELPEGTAGEAGREALWLAIQILGLAAWSFRVVEQDGDMWLRARRPGHVTPGGAHVCYHGTSLGVARKILRADAILPGPNQGASGRAEPVAFMAKSFKLVEQYTGPSKITGTQRLCAVVFGGEAIGDSWKSNNGNYRVATGWLPTTVWLRIWGAGKASDLKRTWAYGGTAFAWPGKQLALAPGRPLLRLRREPLRLCREPLSLHRGQSARGAGWIRRTTRSSSGRGP